MSKEHRFNPYDDNGGTVIGLAGDDYAILAGDTRQSTGYSINSRFEPLCFDMGDGFAMAAVGFQGDSKALVRRVATQIEWYHHDHGKKLQIQSAARMIQQALYNKRFFPFYVQTVIAGLDAEGQGAVYSYDPVGSYEREFARCAGAAASLIMPFLDNQVRFYNQTDPATGQPKVRTGLPLEKAIQIVKDSFSSATERHIQVGDSLQIMIITRDGVQTELFPLKKD